MSDEEKKAIENVNNFIDIVTVLLPKYSSKISEYCIDEESWISIKKLLNLIEKYREQIELFKNANNNACTIIQEVINKNYISKDKIREKIEELDKKQKEELKGTKGQDRYNIKQEYMFKKNILQSLL